MEYLAAYFVEQSLSVDNLFVFILLFRFFQVPKHLQEKVLSYGILGAAVFRGLFVFAGVTLMEQFRAISLLFSAILLTSSGRMLWSSLREAGTDDEDTDEDMSKNVVVRTVTAALPVANDYDGNRFFTSAGDGGKLVATPLLLVLICVELTDVIFALDSVPACLGISRDPLVVYASNMMAIVGLRSWFFVVQEAIRSFRYIEQTLAVVLGLIGSKLALGFFGYEADATLSLSVILGTLAVGYSAGLIFPRSSEKS
jgi:TerC family integral membrane protein